MNVNEFGWVQDDGLGRTSILLKVNNKGEDVNVGYDVKAVSNAVKTNIKSEKKALKTIMNEEYGWFKSDTTVIVKPVEKKPRVRVSFDDN